MNVLMCLVLIKACNGVLRNTDHCGCVTIVNYLAAVAQFWSKPYIIRYVAYTLFTQGYSIQSYWYIYLKHMKYLILYTYILIFNQSMYLNIVCVELYNWKTDIGYVNWISLFFYRNFQFLLSDYNIKSLNIYVKSTILTHRQLSLLCSNLSWQILSCKYSTQPPREP